MFFHCNISYANAPECYVLPTLPVQFCSVITAVQLQWGRHSYYVTGWMVRRLNPGCCKKIPLFHTRPDCLPRSKYCGFFPGVNTHPNLSPMLRITTWIHLIPIWAFRLCYRAIFTFISTWVLNLIMHQQVTVYPRFIWRIIKSIIYEKLMDAVVMTIPTQKLMLV